MPSISNDVLLYTSGQRRKPKLVYDPPLLSSMPTALVSLYEPSHCDEETSAFLGQSRDVSLWRLLVADVLRMFISRTTANGLVGRGGMFVFSKERARLLLRPANTSVAHALPPSHRFGSLLDIGAGDGGVTAKIAELFHRVYATEVSRTMQWRLRRRGYTLLPVMDPYTVAGNKDDARTAPEDVSSDGSRRLFDVIACSNVLDRTDKPLTLLREMRASLKPDGLLILSVVLPWCPFVEFGTQQRRPSETLPMEGGECCKGASYEASLERLVLNVLQPVGFEVVRWTRLPYLCEGNLRVEYALLNDAVLVLKKCSVATADEVRKSQGES